MKYIEVPLLGRQMSFMSNIYVLIERVNNLVKLNRAEIGLKHVKKLLALTPRL